MKIINASIPKILYAIQFMFCIYFIFASKTMNLPVELLQYCIIIVLIGGFLTFLKDVHPRTQSFFMAYSLLILSVIYGYAHGDIGSIQGTFLAIVCLTSLYEDELLGITQMIFIAAVYAFSIIVYPELTFSSLLRNQDIIIKLITLNIGQLVLIIRIARNNKMVKEIARRSEEVENASKLKSDFLANMSHEIRTPLNAIIGMTEFILRDANSAKVKDNALNIKNAGKSLLTIINDILDFSKIEAGKLELIESKYQLSSVLNDVYNMVKIRIDDMPINFVVECDKEIPIELLGDENRIKQVIINLLNNAIKFTKKGEIVIKISGKKNEDNTQILLEINISDTGMGIKTEDMKKLFYSFSQVDTKRNRKVEGTGLGLAICKNIVELMDGKIWVESEYGKGSTFGFSIRQKILNDNPMGDFRHVQNIVENYTLDITAPNSKVLVVDDNEVNLLVAKGMLEPFLMNITTAISAEECFELIADNTYDIIFMDHMMPVMDGVEATQIIRKTNTKVPIVALTANAISGAREMYLENGFSDFLAKPIEIKALTKIVRTLLSDDVVFNTASNKAVNNEPAKIDNEVLLRTAYLEGVRKLPLLKQLYNDRDLINYTIEVHALKSVAETVGDMELSKLAREHEEAKGNVEQKSFEELIEKYQTFLDDLSHLGKKKVDDIDNLKEHLSITEIASLFDSIGEAADSFDMEGIMIAIERLKNTKLFANQVEKLEKIVVAAELLEYDEIIKVCEGERV